MISKLKYLFKKEVYRNTHYSYYLGFSLFRMKFVLYRTIMPYMPNSVILHEFVIFSSFNAAKTHILINYGIEI